MIPLGHQLKILMPITDSAKKALRQSVKRNKRNSTQKERLKKLLKEVSLLVSQGKSADAKAKLPLVYKMLDKAAKTGLIKKNTASRKKSRITKMAAKTEKTPAK